MYLLSRSWFLVLRSCESFSSLDMTMQVRGLPCAHNFHVECIDEWLRLNVKCPRCRCSVFPNLDLSALSNMQTDTERSSVNVVTTMHYVRNQPQSQSYLLTLQGLLRPVRSENAGPAGEVDNGESPASRRHEQENVESVQVVVVEETPRPWAPFLTGSKYSSSNHLKSKNRIWIRK